ncbi:enoyl-CoA hydratase-related protein [Nonomuraea roseola]|uniref:enoyl-CoA hydratase-related protein n=1 Tax=Nonomuraea roseola TaxID=46179 RepID=UPI0031F8EBF6
MQIYRARREGGPPSPRWCSSRPEARNAVDRDDRDALSEAFAAFEESDASVAVLWGEGGTFCAGADLKRVDNHVGEEGGGPMGPTRMRLSKTGHRGRRGPTRVAEAWSSRSLGATLRVVKLRSSAVSRACF